MSVYIAPEKRKQLRGRLVENELLAQYTFWQVGGPADHLYQPADIEDLSLFLSLIPPQEPIYFLGRGSKVLIRDGGFRGTMILMANTLQTLHIEPKTTLVYAEAGVRSMQLAYFTVEQGLTGLEFLAGIPGSVGGALFMNAGAFGSQTWNTVAEVISLDREGHKHVRRAQDYEIGYREIKGFSEEWFVAARFRLQKGNREESQQAIQIMLTKRRASHPLHLPNVGSVFRNPPHDHAARLIESCGLKGYRIGGACVSSQHANFIVNDQQATAADIEKLIDEITHIVQEKTGITLIKEVRLLGDSITA